MRKLKFSTILFALCAAFCATNAPAQSEFPTKPIQLVVPIALGAGADFLARTVADKMSTLLGKPIVVENKAGASGIIASEFVAKAPADGYTLLECYIVTHGTNPAVSKLPYDAVGDFAPVGMIAATPNVLVVNANKVPAKTLQEFVTAAKAQSGAMSYASTGVGSATHLTMEYLMQQAGIKLVQVPYKGAAPGMADLLGGQVEAMFPSLITALSHIRDVRLRALGMASSRRFPLLPDVPTVAELGYPAFNASQWYGLCAPAATPRPVVERLNKALNAVLANPEVKAKLTDAAADVEPMSPEQFADFIRNEIAKWTRLVKAANLKLD